MQSTKYTLNLRDFLKGLLIAGGVPALLIIQQSIAAGEMVFNWQQIWMAAVGGFVTYIIKNYLTNDVKEAQVTLLKAQEKEVEEKKIEAIKPIPPPLVPAKPEQP